MPAWGTRRRPRRSPPTSSIRLFRRITNPGLDPVQPDAEGSFRPYIHTIVIHLCKDYHTNPHRMRMLGLTEAGVVCLEDPKSIDDLGDKLARREAMDLLMERFGALFVAAIRDLKASPHFDPRSLQVSGSIATASGPPTSTPNSAMPRPASPARTPTACEIA